MNNNDIFDRLVPVLGQNEDLVGAYLFGSRAAGDSTVESDVDIGIFFEQKIGLHRLVEIQIAVEEVIGLRVDLVDLRTAGAYLALDIVRGVRFLCADHFRCDEFELLVLSRAGDLAPFERQRRNSLLGMGAS
ncbi:MAG: hypothetical protein DRQ48_08570 [Gammaproteobacteria bacterium]|nr:MAG: hypothetical protein DRQ48_08570 [Gammaproteobacteria bacterium]